MNVFRKILTLMSWTNIIDKFGTKEEQTTSKTWNDILEECDPVINRPIEVAFENQPDLSVIVKVPEIIIPEAQPAIFEPDTGPEEIEVRIPHTSVPYFSFNFVDNKYQTEWARPTEIRKVNNWREENKLAAKMLLDKYEDALTLFYDGSIQSQIMLLSFNDAGKIPRVYCTLINNTNQDTALISLHKTFSFPLRIISLSQDFWKRRANELAIQYKLSDIHDIRLIWASSATSGIPVFSNGIPDIYKHDKTYQMLDKQEKTSLDKKSIIENSSMIPAFFRYTPEQIMSFLAFAPANLYVPANPMFTTSSAKQLYHLAKIHYPELIQDELNLDDLNSLLAPSNFPSHSCQLTILSIDN
jgi:hypothetical protein